METKVDNKGSEERHIAWELTVVLKLLPSEEWVHMLFDKRESLVIKLPHEPRWRVARGTHGSSHKELKERIINTTSLTEFILETKIKNTWPNIFNRYRGIKGTFLNLDNTIS